MSRLALVVCPLLIALAFGCGPKPLPDVTVSGEVKLDGQPMAEGQISFAVPGQPPKELAVKDGKFSGSVKQGKNRVEIRAFKKGKATKMGDQVIEATDENYIDPKYSDNSTLSEEIPASGKTGLSYEVQSIPGAKPK